MNLEARLFLKRNTWITKKGIKRKRSTTNPERDVKKTEAEQNHVQHIGSTITTPVIQPAIKVNTNNVVESKRTVQSVSKFSPLLNGRIMRQVVQYIKNTSAPKAFIQGPSGVGKTSVAHQVALSLGYPLVDVCSIKTSFNESSGHTSTLQRVYSSLFSIRPFVILLDCVESFEKEENDESLIDSIGKLLKNCQRKHNPIIFTCTDKSTAHIRSLATICRIFYINISPNHAVQEWIRIHHIPSPSHRVATQIALRGNGNLHHIKLMLNEINLGRKLDGLDKCQFSHNAWSNINSSLRMMHGAFHHGSNNKIASRDKFLKLCHMQPYLTLEGIWGRYTHDKFNYDLDHLTEISDCLSLHDSMVTNRRHMTNQLVDSTFCQLLRFK